MTTTTATTETRPGYDDYRLPDDAGRHGGLSVALFGGWETAAVRREIGGRMRDECGNDHYVRVRRTNRSGNRPVFWRVVIVCATEPVIRFYADVRAGRETLPYRSDAVRVAADRFPEYATAGTFRPVDDDEQVIGRRNTAAERVAEQVAVIYEPTIRRVAAERAAAGRTDDDVVADDPADIIPAAIADIIRNDVPPVPRPTDYGQFEPVRNDDDDGTWRICGPAWDNSAATANGFGQWLTIPYSSYAAAADAANRLSAVIRFLVGFDAAGSDPGAADLIAALRTERPDGDISPTTATLIREIFEQSMTDGNDDEQGSEPEPVPNRNEQLAAEHPDGYVPAETAIRLLRDGETLAAGHYKPEPTGSVPRFVWVAHTRPVAGRECSVRLLRDGDGRTMRPGGYDDGFVRCSGCGISDIPAAAAEQVRDDALLRVAASRPVIPERNER